MTTISDPAIPLATSVGSTDLFLIDQVDVTSITGYRTKRATGAILAALPLVIGAFVQANSYSAGATGAGLLMTRGATLSPSTDGVATGIFQAVANVTSGSGECLYASMIKLGTANNVDYHAVYGECVDNAGGAGSSIAGGRFTASLLVGTGGNATGVTNVAIATVAYAFLIGNEAQVWNQVADATTTFSSSLFDAGYLASNAGTKKSFAAFMTNPDGVTIPWINGLYVASGTLQDSVVRSDATSAYGINFLNGTFTTAAFRSPNFQVDGSGTITAGAMVNGSGALQLGTSTGTIKFGCSGTTTATGAQAVTPPGSTGVSGHGTIQEWFTYTNSAGTVRYVAAY